jgi:class 3 adenylate cyclase
MARYWEVINFDLTSVLPHVQAPTEVLIHEGVLGTPLAVAEAICAAVPNSSGLRQIASTDPALWAPHPESVYQDLQNFIREVAGIEPPPRAERVFAVCLFTDVVGSTRHLVEVGDQRWQELLDVHDSVARREIERARGRLIDQTGDGVFATFDAPARAIACATAIQSQLRYVGIDVRAGLHAGEIELRGDNVGGIAVHIAARVIAFAGPGEVLVSSTMKDLVTGSGLRFEDRGVHILKGIPEPWQIYATEMDPSGGA